MEATYVIKKPLLTEKSTFAMNEQKRYSFLVDRHASKTDIKAAVEKLYGVRVAGVNTQCHKGRKRRLKFGWSQDPVEKTAVVRLHADDTIEMF